MESIQVHVYPPSSSFRGILFSREDYYSWLQRILEYQLTWASDLESYDDDDDSFFTFAMKPCLKESPVDVRIAQLRENDKGDSSFVYVWAKNRNEREKEGPFLKALPATSLFRFDLKHLLVFFFHSDA